MITYDYAQLYDIPEYAPVWGGLTSDKYINWE